MVLTEEDAINVRVAFTDTLKIRACGVTLFRSILGNTMRSWSDHHRRGNGQSGGQGGPGHAQHSNLSDCEMARRRSFVVDIVFCLSRIRSRS